MIDHEIIERVSSLRATVDTKFELLRVLSLYQRMFPDSQNFNRLAIWKVTGGDEYQEVQCSEDPDHDIGLAN
jgi:hypothetical protein